MSAFKSWLACLVVLFAADVASAFTTNDAVTIFDAYNTAFRDGTGYYPGWWTGAEEIEMAEDAYDNSPTAARKTAVANACSQFTSHNGSSWFTSTASHYNEYNDDISWAAIAFARGYLITGNTTFRDVAKTNWDGMYNRAWDTNYFGGGLFWRQSDKASKNACVEGPATIAACYLYNIFGDTNYLNKAQAIYAFNRQVLMNTGTGAVF
jgi:predicted alpha-1,6-mannanase (GH76 family)